MAEDTIDFKGKPKHTKKKSKIYIYTVQKPLRFPSNKRLKYT